MKYRLKPMKSATGIAKKKHREQQARKVKPKRRKNTRGSGNRIKLRSPVVPVNKFQTSDGKTWKHERNAIRHERMIVIRDMIEKELDDDPDQDEMAARNTLYEALAKQFDTIIDTVYAAKLMPPGYGTRGDF